MRIQFRVSPWAQRGLLRPQGVFETENLESRRNDTIRNLGR